MLVLSVFADEIGIFLRFYIAKTKKIQLNFYTELYFMENLFFASSFAWLHIQILEVFAKKVVFGNMENVVFKLEGIKHS